MADNSAINHSDAKVNDLKSRLENLRAELDKDQTLLRLRQDFDRILLPGSSGPAQELRGHTSKMLTALNNTVDSLVTKILADLSVNLDKTNTDFNNNESNNNALAQQMLSQTSGGNQTTGS